MFKDNGRNITHQEAVINTLAEITQPWLQAGIRPPYVSVSEIARTAGLSKGRVTYIILRNTDLFLQDIRGNTVNGNLREAAIDSAPFKRVAQATQNNSRSFAATALKMGIGRLRKSFFPD